MKTHLMFADRDFAIERDEGVGEPDLVADLGLDTVWDAMADGDDFIRKVARSATLSSLSSVDAIRYRQYVLADCLREPELVGELYGIAVAAIAEQRSVYRSSMLSDRGEALLGRSLATLAAFVGRLRDLRSFAESYADRFESRGFSGFFEQVRANLDEDYFTQVEAHLEGLRFRDGLLLSGRLGAANRGTGYLLRSPRPENQGGWLRRVPLRKPTYSFTIPDRDEAGFEGLRELRDQGLDPVADATARSADHVLSFFVALRTELAFYLGAQNLRGRLAGSGRPHCFPDPQPCEDGSLHARDLYDPGLALRVERAVVGNDVDADGTRLVLVTGANQGGKSTFLRSLGLAHLMMQCGMFVAASAFTAATVTGVFTHYKREEDSSMQRGKLDEELSRMSAIADAIKPGSLLLCNESFASTNEREGSHIAAEIIRALNDSGVRVVFVTHMYELAHGRYDEHSDDTLFLRAEREVAGERSYRLSIGEPERTSYGQDLYARTFGSAA